MVTRVLSIINRKLNGLHQAAFLLAFAALASQILGLLRDRLLAHYFGAGQALDIYFASFKVPDFLFNTLAPLVSVTILLPFIIEKLGENEDNKKSALNFLNSVFTAFFVLILVASGLLFFFMPKLAGFVVPGFSGESLESFITLSRIMLLSPLFLGISNLFGSVTQTYRRFYVYSLSPILYNLGIILGIVFLFPKFGLTGLVFGVVIGSVLHLLIQVPSVIKEGLFPGLTLNIDWEEIGKVFFTAIPRTVTLSAHALVFIVLVNIASQQASGSIAILQFSNALQRVPMIIIGISYSVAAFPALAKLFTSGERGKFVDQVVTAARHIIFWSLPIASLFIVLRAQVVRTILGTGEFDWTNTRLTAAALAIFAISVVAQSLVQLFVRAYYAGGNTRKPLYASIISSVVIIAGAFYFENLYTKSEGLRLFFESMFKVNGVPGTEVLMLPFAFSIGLLLNMILLWLMFRREFSEFIGRVGLTWRHSLYSSVIMGFVAYQFLRVFDDVFNIETLIGIFMQGLLAGIFGIIAGVFVLKLLGNQEIRDLQVAIHTKFWKGRPVQPGADESGGTGL